MQIQFMNLDIGQQSNLKMDKKALIKALRDTVQSASNTVASGVSAPVDLIAAGLRKVGMPIPQAPVGGSQWMENVGLTIPVEDGIPKLAGETLGMIVPMAATAKAPQIAAAANRGLENLAAPRTLNTPGYGGQRGAVGFVYPQQEALDIAQRNAAKPVSEGGLGLPPNNTAMDRAKAMGFDTDAYHATGADINYFIPHPYRGAVSVAATPDSAMRGALAGVADNTSVGATNIIPLMMRSEGVQGLRLPQNQVDFMKKLPEQANESQVIELMKNAPKGSNWFNYFDEIQKPDNTFVYVKKTEPKVSFADVQKTKRGADGSNLPDWGNEKWSSQQQKQMGGKGWLQADEAGISASIVDPTILRSRFAAFDPARINENNLLGYADPRLLGLLGLGTAGGIGAYNYMQGK